MYEIITNAKLWVIVNILSLVAIDNKTPIDAQVVKSNVSLINLNGGPYPSESDLDMYLITLRKYVSESLYKTLVEIADIRNAILEKDVNGSIVNYNNTDPQLTRVRKLLDVVLKRRGYNVILKLQLKRILRRM